MQLPYHDARTKEQPVKLEEKISFTVIGWDNTPRYIGSNYRNVIYNKNERKLISASMKTLHENNATLFNFAVTQNILWKHYLISIAETKIYMKLVKYLNTNSL